MNILVTGAEGFIGSHLVAYLENAGHSVESFDITNEESQDVSSYESLSAAVKRNDYVYHLAAVADVWDTDKSRLFDSNIMGVRNIARVASETGTPTIVTSSVTARNPTNLYAETKKIGEDILACSDSPVKWVRLSNVVGAGTDKGQVAAMVEQAVTDGEIEVWGNGEIRRSYVSVDRVCEQLVEILENDENGFCGEIGSQTMTNREMAEVIALCCDHSVTIQPIDKMPPSPKELVVEDCDEVLIQPAVQSLVASKQAN